MKNKNEGKVILDQKYSIIKKIDNGGSSVVYLVEENESKKIYAAKILKEETPLYEKEINALNKLQNVNCPYILKMIINSKGKIVRENNSTKIKEYLILEYAENGDLFNYIYYSGKGFGEKLGKLLFYKILLGIKACHDTNICHRDIKLENILLNDKFEPKIADFGFADEIKIRDEVNLLTERVGTDGYVPPEILNSQPYDGSKADIFSLGALLMPLVTGKIGFQNAMGKDQNYRLIRRGKINDYWESVEKKTGELSPEFKNLFIKMVTNKTELRPSIEEILKDEWLKEIRDLDKDKIKELDSLLYEIFMEKQIKVKELLKEKENKKIKKEDFDFE